MFQSCLLFSLVVLGEKVKIHCRVIVVNDYVVLVTSFKHGLFFVRGDDQSVAELFCGVAFLHGRWLQTHDCAMEDVAQVEG